MGKVVVALSSHRVEVLGYMEKEMSGYEAIVLEEAENPEFNLMLDKKTSIESYISRVFPPFPEFSKRLYKLLRKFYKNGKKILQVEPYLTTLEKIYKKIEVENPSPADLEQDRELGEVYRKESEVFQALLKFYENSHDFERAIDAVINFASKDASRIKLRDRLRARAIKELEYESIYVEAGYIHFPLANYLRAKRIFLLEEPTKKLIKLRHALSPSDLLTLRMMHVKKPGERERILAAKCLIYVSLLTRREMLPSPTRPYPHLEEEARIIRFTRKLDYEDCRKYFLMLKSIRREHAWRLLEKNGLI